MSGRRRLANWLAAAVLRAGGLALALLVGCVGLAAAAADPAASSWFETDQGRLRLIAASPAVGNGEAVSLGLEFRLAPGWKIYWRSPGDAGLPPTVDWSGSTNLAGADIAWPAPQRFSAFGLETIGYEGDVVLPVTARLVQAGRALGLRAAVQYLTCKEICIPYETTLALDLPEGGATSAGGHRDLIDRAAGLVPGEGAAGGLRLTAATLVPGSKPELDLALEADQAFAAPDAFIEGPAGIAFGAPRLTRGADARHVDLAVPVSGAAGTIRALVDGRLRITIVDGSRAAETDAVPKQGLPARDLGLLAVMLGVALLGGFILNFMPCVLPVLSIKLLSVTAQAGRPRGAIRGAFLATAAGILASFLALALTMLALRQAGVAVGWGMQFQQPVFLTFMAALLTVFACNLAGFFEIGLPGWLGAAAGSDLPRGHLGDFAAGAVATLLATPCSAPFLGTAVGFALAGDALDILAIFLALGIGLALPFLAVAALPGIAARLPRPGRWMVILRRILAVFLAVSALWLVSVLAAQTSPLAAAGVATALVAAALMLRFAPPSMLRPVAVAAALVAAFALPALLPMPAARVAADGTLWRRFDPQAIGSLVQGGKAVFVDVTADWCLNCKLNERLILGSDEIQRRLSRPDIVAMRADWTRPDEAIGAFLRGFGRYGIPFYAVYGPSTPDGQPLPEILTRSQVLEALRKAAPAALAASPPGAADGG